MTNTLPHQPPIQALVNLLHAGQFDHLAQQAGECAARWPNSAPVWHLLGLAHLSAGRAEQAAMPLTRAAKLLPGDPAIHEQLATALMHCGRKKEALRSFERCLALAPQHFAALVNCASLANDAGGYATAEKHSRQALKLAPDQAEAIFNLGRAQAGQGKVTDAIATFRRVAAMAPDSSVAQNDIGLQLLDLGATGDAESCLRRAITLAPGNAMAHSNLGRLLQGQGRSEAALASFREASRLQPGLAEIHTNIGGLLNATKQYREAEAACRQAIALNPRLTGAITNLGGALLGQRRFAEAESCYKAALAAEANNADARNNLGNLMLELKRFDEAEKCFRAIKDDHGYALGQAFHCASHLCDWRQRDRDAAALRAALRQDQAQLDPFGLLSLAAPDAGALQRRASWLEATNHYGPLLGQPALVAPETHPQRDRLRIGYLSADFHDHATMHLLAGVLQAHDRGRYAIHLYSYGPDAQDAYRKIAEENCDQFRDIKEMTDRAAAGQIAADGIDLLIDLKGYTRDSRLGITALRPAPLVISWLGYPGTLGHPRLADYLIGDPVVTPLESATQYSEALALMPHCYQPNDRNRVIGPRPSRESAGLPDEGLVFCCFNQSYKFDPQTFDLWCQLLRSIPGSVLWLLQASVATEANLQREAASRGIAATRLVFAPKLPLADHLARLQLADLALDTHPYGSHTTGSDALWAGVPLLALRGDTFASRVSASLLQAMNLPELIADCREQYAALALRLASEPETLAALRTKIARQRELAPLFDTARFTRHLETLFDRIWTQHATGERQSLAIGESDPE